MTEAGVSPGDRADAKPCLCPYCEHEEEQPFPFCAACGQMINVCVQCGTQFLKDVDECPRCGARVGDEKE